MCTYSKVARSPSTEVLPAPCPFHSERTNENFSKSKYTFYGWQQQRHLQKDCDNWFFEMPNLIALINNQSPNVRTYRHYLRLLVDGYCAYNLLTLAETSEYREHGIGTYTIAIKLK